MKIGASAREILNCSGGWIRIIALKLIASAANIIATNHPLKATSQFVSMIRRRAEADIAISNERSELKKNSLIM